MVISDGDNQETLTIPQKRLLLNRVITLIEFDIQWDIDEKIDGQIWTQMNIEELADKLSEDIHYKLLDEYNDMKEEGRFDNEEV